MKFRLNVTPRLSTTTRVSHGKTVNDHFASELGALLGFDVCKLIHILDQILSLPKLYPLSRVSSNSTTHLLRCGFTGDVPLQLCDPLNWGHWLEVDRDQARKCTISSLHGREVKLPAENLTRQA